MSDRPTLRRRVRTVLLPIYKPTRSELLPGPGRYLLRTPLVFELWYRMRAWWFLVRTKSVTAADSDATAVPSDVLGRVFRYNKGKLWEFYRARTEKLMSVVQCVGTIKPDARVLCIGPRNEAELLLMSLYGFKLDNITGVDLFSYSPRIQCMDMHKLEFADATFDVGYSAWTLTYSPDVRRACSELARVVKPGGTIAVGFDYYPGTNEFVGDHPLPGGLNDLEEIFRPYIDWVYWQEVAPAKDEPVTKHVTFVFRRNSEPCKAD